MNERNVQDLSQAQRERLAFVEFRLWFLGDVRHPDLIDRFGIAPAVTTRPRRLQGDRARKYRL